MPVTSTFYPPRRRGLIIHGLAALLMGIGGGIAFWLALQGEVGARFILLLMASILLLAPLPLVLYRAYALWQANYHMDRDGLRLRWGLRAEDIPLPEVEWIRPAAEMGFRLPLPFWRAPGAILGARNIEGLGPVEFMASEVKPLLLIATPRRVYAISPADREGFEHAFYRIIELGSLTPLSPFSARPVAFAQRIWQDRLARMLIITGFGLGGLLFLASAWVMATQASISLGFAANLQPFEPGPPERLLLLPVMGSLAYLLDLTAGVFFYRRAEQRPVAYLVWVGCVLTPLLLLIGLAFI